MSERPADTDGPSLEYVTTADGARLACKRNPADGPAVIFLHGLAVNADLWDIPDQSRAGAYFRSLPNLLHDRGYDVWLVNFRGHGGPHMLSSPPPEQSDYTVDHLIAYDLPAVIEHVNDSRGKRPWIIGNSMGAMVTAGFLQGASIIREAGRERVIGDEGLARCRQDRIRGCVLLEFPAALRWPAPLYDGAGVFQWRGLFREWQRDDGRNNFTFEMLARSNALDLIVRATGEIPLRWLRPSAKGAASWRDSLPPLLADSLQWTDDAWNTTAQRFIEQFKGTQNFDRGLFAEGFLPSLDHIKAGVLRQMGKSVRARAFVSGLESDEYVYSEHYGRIEAPLLLLLGGKDRIANAQIVRDVFYDRVRSADKTIHVFPRIAHGDFEWALIAAERVYPIVCDWLTQRDAGASQHE